MSNASKSQRIEINSTSLSSYSREQRGSRPRLPEDLLQDGEWERRMRQLNPAWTPSVNELDA